MLRIWRCFDVSDGWNLFDEYHEIKDAQSLLYFSLQCPHKNRWDSDLLFKVKIISNILFQKVKSGHSKASTRVFCVFGLQENPLMKPNRIPLKSQSWQIRIPIQSSGQTCPTKSTCQSLGWREISLRKSIAFQYKSSKGIYGDRVTFRFKYRCWLDHSFLVYKNQTRMSPQKWSNSETNDSAQLLLYHYNIKEYNLYRSLFSDKTSHESYHGPWYTLYHHKTDE